MHRCALGFGRLYLKLSLSTERGPLNHCLDISFHHQMPNDSSWLCHECTRVLVCVCLCASVCLCVCVRHRASAVCAAAPKLGETARWNECLLSKACGSKLILVSDVNLRIGLLCGVQAHADTWWCGGQSVRAYAPVCACVRARPSVWVMLHLPFPNVTEGPTPEERARNVGPGAFVYVGVCISR